MYIVQTYQRPSHLFKKKFPQKMLDMLICLKKALQILFILLYMVISSSFLKYNFFGFGNFI
jgi:hypothetical protein